MIKEEKEIQEGKFFAIISYLTFLCIVSLVLKNKNKFAVFHAKQGLVLFVFEVASFIISIIPFLRAVTTLAFVIFFLCSLWGMLQALSGKCNRIPIISEVADKIII